MNDMATPAIVGIDWDTQLQSIWGDDIPLVTDRGAPLTLRYAVVEALGGAYAGEERVSGEERTLRWELAEKIMRWQPGQQIKLKADQLGTIKGVVLKRWPQSFLYTQIVRLLDPGEVPG